MNKIKKLLAGIISLIMLMPMSVVAYDDYNTREVGVEWVQDYVHCGQPNLYYTKSDAESFYNALGNKGWIKRFNYGNGLAWESDFEKSSVGGSDYIYADAVDFAYFSGHGAEDGFWFGDPHDGNNYLSCRVDKSESSFGETDLEWIVLSACNVLQFNSGSGNVFQRWLQAFKGLHQILGYDTTSVDYSIGGRFVFWMTKEWWQWPWFVSKKNIRNAWFQANIDIQPSWVYSAVLGTDNGWNDYLPGYGSVGADGGYIYRWQRVQS